MARGRAAVAAAEGWPVGGQDLFDLGQGWVDGRGGVQRGDRHLLEVLIEADLT